MSDKKETPCDSINFIKNCEQEITRIDEYLEFELQYVLGKVDINSNTCQTMLKTITDANTTNFNLNTIIKKYYNLLPFKTALRMFQENNFERRLPPHSTETVKQNFLISNQTIFMYCATLFFCQIETYISEGSHKYKLQNLDDHGNEIKAFKIKLAKLWMLPNPDKIKIILPKEIVDSITMLKDLTIKSENGASRKIALNLFYTFFGTMFKVNKKDQKNLILILTELSNICYPGTDEDKVRRLTSKVRKLMSECNPS